MSKNVAILEGDVARRFNGVKKIQLHNTGGGTDYWVPESETKLVTKHINENGTYKAEDEEGHPYGYSQVTVSGIGTATGYDENDDLVDVYADENGKLKKKYAPVSIAFTVPPTRLEYADGDEISLAGATVRAYLKNGDPWEGDEQHPNGYISLAELTLEPTKADASKVEETTIGYDGEELDTGLITQPIKLTPYTKVMMDHPNEKPFIADTALNDARMTSIIALSPTFGILNYQVVIAASKNSSELVKHDLVYTNWSDSVIKEGVPISMYDNDFYKLNMGTSYGSAVSVEGIEGIPYVYENQAANLTQEQINNVAFILANGRIVSGGGQKIKVTWKRNKDEALETSLTIQVHREIDDENYISGGGGGHDF